VIKKTSFFALFIFLVLGYQNSNAQVNTGGNVSISYDNGVYLDIAPILGYRLDKINAGISPVFSYKKPDNSNQSFYAAGARLFGQYFVIENAFVHAEFQTMNNQTTTILTDGSRIHNRLWTYGLPVGAGYEQRLNDKTRLQASVLYDVLQDKNNPNNMPVVRGGIFYDL
jgi:hypothetical protein